MNLNLKYYIILPLLFLAITSCNLNEDEFENVTETELVEMGLDTLFENRRLERDSSDQLIVPEEILKDEGYQFLSDENDSWVRKITFNGNTYELKYPLYHIYIFEDYIIIFTGMIGIESGFFKYFVTPKHTYLITFRRENFEFIDQKVIMGIVRNIQLVRGNVYFRVETDSGYRYGKYPIQK